MRLILYKSVIFIDFMLYKSLVRFNLKLTLKKLALSFYFLATGERNLAKG